jgi:hypothetical protein
MEEKQIRRAGYQVQSVLPLQVKPSMELGLAVRDFHEHFQMYHADKLSEFGAGGKFIQD